MGWHTFAALCAANTFFISASLSANKAIPHAGQFIETRSIAGSHTPVRQPRHRSCSGTPLSALSICNPHPAHVAFPHVAHLQRQHIAGFCGEDGTGWVGSN